jgi:2-C-methyl-D-erythritol 4-phosphate cytidylyltransferase
MGSVIPKQFIELNGRPILMHTLENLQAIDPEMELVLVLPSDQRVFWSDLVVKHSFSVPHRLANGGNTRFESVKNGLAMVTDADVIGVHDGVRPFVSNEVVLACFEMARSEGAAIPVVPIVQSLRRTDTEPSRAVDRSSYRAVQTPQCFSSEVLRKAYESAASTEYSDDASVVESIGKNIYLVEGNEDNIKITSPLDLELAQLIIGRRKRPE